MWTSSKRFPWRKTLLTSNWCICQQRVNAKVRITFMVCDRTTSANISWKSTLDHWVKPFDTRCALCLCIVPSRRCLMRKSHLHPTMFWLLGGGTNNHMPLRRSAVHQTHLLWLAASDYWYHIEDMGIWILLIYEPRYRLFLYRLNCYNWVLLISCNLYQDKCWK